MERFKLSVQKCQTTLDWYDQSFATLLRYLNTQLQQIVSDTGCLCSNAAQLDQKLASWRDVWAEKFLNTECLVETLFSWKYKHNVDHSPFSSCPNALPLELENVPHFTQWTAAISCLQALITKQSLLEISPEIVSLSEFQRYVQTVLTHLDQLGELMTGFSNALSTAQHEVNTGVLLRMDSNWHHVDKVFSTMDLYTYSRMIHDIRALTCEVLERFSLVIVEQPQTVLLKLPRQRRKRLPHQKKDFAVPASMSMVLLNYEGRRKIQDIPNVSINLINESRAQEYQRNPNASYLSNGKNLHHSNNTVEPKKKFVVQMSDLTTNDTHITERNICAGVPQASKISIKNLNMGESDTITKAETTPFVYFFLVTLQPTASEGFELPLTIWTLSTPVAVYRCPFQRAAALASMSWWTHFSENNSIPVSLQPTASLREIEHVLSIHFERWTRCSINRGEKSLALKKSHKKYLMKTLLKYTQNDCTNFSKPEEDQLSILSLKRFYHANPPGKTFTFWSWFYKATSLLQTQPYLRQLWRNGYLAGFISKEDARRKLLRPSMRPGDFLLRFSESLESTVCATFVSDKVDRNCCSVYHYIFQLDHNSPAAFKSSFLKEIDKDVMVGSTLQKAFSRLYPDKCRHTVFCQNEEGNMNVEECHVYQNMTETSSEEEDDTEWNFRDKRIDTVDSPYVSVVALISTNVVRTGTK